MTNEAYFEALAKAWEADDLRVMRRLNDVLAASDTLRPGPPYRGVVYYDPDTDPTPPALRPVPKRPSPYVHTPAPARSVECPCGIHRSDCEYHR